MKYLLDKPLVLLRQLLIDMLGALLHKIERFLQEHSPLILQVHSMRFLRCFHRLVQLRLDEVTEGSVVPHPGWTTRRQYAHAQTILPLFFGLLGHL